MKPFGGPIGRCVLASAECWQGSLPLGIRENLRFELDFSDDGTGFLVPTYWARCDGDLATDGPLLGTDYENLCLGQSVATDMGDFSRFLQQLIENPDIRARMAERSRARAVELYSYKGVAVRFLASQQTESRSPAPAESGIILESLCDNGSCSGAL